MPNLPVSIGNHADDGLLKRVAQFSDDLKSSLSKHGSVSIDLSEVRDPDTVHVEPAGMDDDDLLDDGLF
ncbi:hypothetical protein IFT82_09880 [Sphingomonas sp. CFBP 8760]|nr:hypothetical protein [Sphingomonas sp. CFBP 8760]